MKASEAQKLQRVKTTKMHTLVSLMLLRGLKLEH